MQNISWELLCTQIFRFEFFVGTFLLQVHLTYDNIANNPKVQQFWCISTFMFWISSIYIYERYDF